MSFAAAGASGFNTPILLKYGQDLSYSGWFTGNAAHAGTRPFDGVFLYLFDSSNRVFQHAFDLTVEAVEAEMVGFHAAPLGNLQYNFPILRITTLPPDLPDWWDDTEWARVCSNGANFAQGVQGAKVAGLALDNEHYFDEEVYPAGPTLFDWVEAGGIDPTHTLAQSRQKVYQRGGEFMSAIIAVWPDVRVIPLHGPYISDERTGNEVWTNTATDPPFWNPVWFANELSAFFTWGMANATAGTAAKVYDGGEVYGVRSEQAIRNVRAWQLDGIHQGATIVPLELRGDAYPLSATQGLMDKDEFADPPFSSIQPASQIQDQVMWALRTHDIVWYYSENHEWWEGFSWGDHLNIDLASQDAWWDAVAIGRALGQGATVPTSRAVAKFGNHTIGASTTTLATNTRYGSKFTSTVAANITRVSAYLDGAGSGTGSQVAMATVYAGDGTADAGVLQATSAEVTVTDGQAAGWVDFAFWPAVALAAGTWWLQLHCGGNTNTIRMHRDATASQSGSATDAYSGGAADPGGTMTLAAGPFSIAAFGS